MKKRLHFRRHICNELAELRNFCFKIDIFCFKIDIFCLHFCDFCLYFSQRSLCLSHSFANLDYFTIFIPHEEFFATLHVSPKLKISFRSHQMRVNLQLLTSFPQVLTLKTPSAYSVLHCPRRIPPNPAGGGFAGSSGCGSASSARAVFAQHNAHARRSRKSFQIASLTRGLVFVFFSFSSFVNVVRLPFFIATFAVVFVEVLESISCFLPDLCIAGMTNAHTRKAYKF